MENRQGQCRCGSVRFELSKSPLITMACHCTGCQRMTSSAYSLSELHYSSSFKLIDGEPVLGGLRAETKHFFCPDCKSWLFTRPEEDGDFVNVRATMLDDAHLFKPFLEAYTDEKLPWADTGAIRSFEKFPKEDDFPDLLQQYKQQ